MLGTTLEPLFLYIFFGVLTWDPHKQIVAKTRESTSYPFSKRYEGPMLR